MVEIVAREPEIEQFQAIMKRSEAVLLAVYGRRRIGKTYLLKNFFKDKGLFFQVTGIHDASLGVQLSNFNTEYKDVFHCKESSEVPKTWFEAFDRLRRKAEENKNSGKKTILFFDEVPWLATARSGFLQALEHSWNRYLCDIDNIIVIVCGSAASWMIQNIIDNRGGLHGRVTHEIRLLPFTLRETEQYLLSRHIEYDRKQIIELYMALGGVAHYLKQVQRGKSAIQNINELLFSKQGMLFNEFDRLFHSLFKDYEKHLRIIKALVKRKSGYNYSELSKMVKLASGGSFSRILKELQESGFIMLYQEVGDDTAQRKYRLVDEFSLFYLNWIATIPDFDLKEYDENYWFKQHQTAAWRAWSGHAFETICIKHLNRIKDSLGISGVNTIASKWVHRAADQKGGAEIDLVIDRADNCINLCEMRYYNDVYELDKQYASRLITKKEIYREASETKKALFTTLITIYGAKENAHYFHAIDKQLNVDDLF